jgi:endoglucanase
MSARVPRHRRRPLAALATLLVVAAAGAGACTPSSGGGSQLYRDPDTQARAWVDDHPGDSRAAVIRDRIASQPQARWFNDADPGRAAAEVRAYVGSAVAAGQVPAIVVYALPGRDCGGASNGGAADHATYRSWTGALATALGTQLGGRRALVLLEPDGLASEDCLTPAQADARHASLADAVTKLRAAGPGIEVYLDAGHSNWHPVAEQARRLRAAGVASSSGIVTNVSNYNTTAAEVAYGKDLLAALGGPALRQVVDVSRNGNGPAPDDAWCDPPGRAIGRAPTLATGEPTVAAYLWVKLPGEADGCAAAAGAFVPDLAYSLATG